jgi:hypothetical protein
MHPSSYPPQGKIGSCTASIKMKNVGFIIFELLFPEQMVAKQGFSLRLRRHRKLGRCFAIL